jgi:ribosomal protein S18 acetylase RimI-like enzyme
MVIGGGYTNPTDHLRKPGCEKLNLQVRNGNASAESFYESLGFILGYILGYILGLIKEPRTSMGKLLV